MTLVHVLVAALLVAGLVGAVVPLVPGTPLILAAALVYAVATDWQPVGIGRLLILAGLGALAYALDALAGALGTRALGGTWWAVAGALVGTLVGLFFAPLGLLLGPLAGATLGELIRTRHLRDSVKSGVGALVGLLAGAAAKLAVALAMTGLLLWWIWRA
jgi:uncharacterized protein YqgC (DUF456 family)